MLNRLLVEVLSSLSSAWDFPACHRSSAETESLLFICSLIGCHQFTRLSTADPHMPIVPAEDERQDGPPAGGSLEEVDGGPWGGSRVGLNPPQTPLPRGTLKGSRVCVPTRLRVST